MSAAALVVPALKRHTATVIMAHGLGDTGAGWVFLAENWRLKSKFEEVKFVFPNAPVIPITINRGMRMPGWYDIISLSSIDRSEDEPGITRSQQKFHELISSEIENGIPANRIVVGGFSQGGAIALFSGLSYSQKLGGIVGLSCYLLLRNNFKDVVARGGDANKETKIFMGHGDSDDVVRHEYGKMSADQLKGWGYNVDFKTYPGLTHSADPEEIDDLEKFLNETIPPLGDQSQEQGNL